MKVEVKIMEQPFIKGAYLREGVYYSGFRMKVDGKSKRFRKKLSRDPVIARKLLKILKANALREADNLTEVLGRVTLDGIKKVVTLKFGGLKVQVSYEPKQVSNMFTSENMQSFEIRG